MNTQYTNRMVEDEDKIIDLVKFGEDQTGHALRRKFWYNRRLGFYGMLIITKHSATMRSCPFRIFSTYNVIGDYQE